MLERLISDAQGFIIDFDKLQAGVLDPCHALLDHGLAIGVATWMWSPIKFQADMGKLLTFMFLLNMVGALTLLPALAAYILPREVRE